MFGQCGQWLYWLLLFLSCRIFTLSAFERRLFQINCGNVCQKAMFCRWWMWTMTVLEWFLFIMSSCFNSLITEDSLNQFWLYELRGSDANTTAQEFHFHESLISFAVGTVEWSFQTHDFYITLNSYNLLQCSIIYYNDIVFIKSYFMRIRHDFFFHG